MRQRRRILPRLRMHSASLAAHKDSALLQQRSKQLSVGRSRLFDGQSFIITGIPQRNRSPESEFQRSRFAQHADVSRDSARCCSDKISHRVVAGVRIKCEQRPLSNAIGRFETRKDHIVIDRQGRNRRAVIPHQIVLRPAFAVALVYEIAVIANDVAIDHSHAGCGHLVDEFVEHSRMLGYALGLLRVWQNASGEIGIASSDENQVTGNAAAAVRRTGGFNRRREFVIRAD